MKMDSRLTYDPQLTLQYNLQFFAQDGPGGEKTEEPTSKKLSDSRKEGQVAKSKEFASGLSLLALFLILRFWIGNIGIQLIEVFPAIYNRIPETVTFWEGYLPQNAIQIVFRQLLLQIIMIVAPILVIAFLIAFISDLVQVKWVISGKPLKPKLSKLNPIKGFKKILSMNSLIELLKSVAKIGIIVYICYNYLKDRWQYIFLLYDIPLMQGIQLLGETLTDLGIRISAIYMVIAFLDYAYQKYKHKKDLKMTKQEVKDEHKQQEGDPLTKGRIRSKMREASQRRMMKDLLQADVVITNPTHLAVAIKYDGESQEAPVVLAKGEDFLAARIKEVAKENSIEIVENKPLARMLYANVDIGEAIPPELYQAVAEVLAYVYHLQGRV